MATSFKARVNKLKNTRVSVSQKSEKSAPETPLSASLEEDTLKAWIHSTNNISSAITRIESDVNSVKSDRERVIKLEVELEKLMQLIANKDYFKNIFMEMLDNMEPEPEPEPEPEKEEEPEWKIYINNELNNLRSILNNTHNSISNSIEEINQNNSEKINFLEEKINDKEIFSELNNLKEVFDNELKKHSSDLRNAVDGLDTKVSTFKQDHKKDTSELKDQYQKDVLDLKKEIQWTNSELYALKQDYAAMVNNQKNLKNDIEILEIFKNKQKKNNELIEENSDNLEKIKKENINFKHRVETIEKITKETSTIFVTKVADLADYTKKLDGRLGKCENYSKDLGISLGNVKQLFDGERASLSKIISNLKDDFVDLHERCDNTLSTLYRNDTQHIIDKYVFELSQLNVLFESSKTMQRENNYFKCIGNLSNRLDKIEQKIN